MDMKECITCGVVKPLSEYYKHKAMKDGHLGKCKGCQKTNTKKNYRKNPAKRKEYERLRAKRPERKSQIAEIQRRIRTRDENKKTNMYARIRTAKKNGTIVQKPCPCGNPSVHAHHEDYSKEFDIEWLCEPCHIVRHGKTPIGPL